MLLWNNFCKPISCLFPFSSWQIAPLTMCSRLLTCTYHSHLCNVYILALHTYLLALSLVSSFVLRLPLCIPCSHYGGSACLSTDTMSAFLFLDPVCPTL